MTAGLDLGRYAGGAVGVDVAGYDASRAALSEPEAQRPADAARPPGDDGDLAADLPVFSLSPLSLV